MQSFSNGWPAVMLAAPLVLTAAAHSAPEAAGVRLAAPEVHAGGYRIVVEQVTQAQSFTQEYPEPAREVVTGHQSVAVNLAVYPPANVAVNRIDGLDSKILAFWQNRPITFRSNPPDDSTPLVTGAWRTVLQAAEMETSVARLGKLQGELIVYPRSRVVTMDFPLNGRFPATKEEEGFRATVSQVKTRTGAMSLSVETRWADTVHVARTNPEAPSGVTAITRLGTPVLPTGGGNSVTEKDGVSIHQSNLTFTELKELPTSIRVEALVRSGTPQHLPFVLPDLSLPTSAGVEREIAAGVSRPEAPANTPLFSDQGGTLIASVRMAAGVSEGTLLIGFSRKDASGYGPRRWLEAGVQKDGTVQLGGIRPGHYRISRAWMPEARPTGTPAPRESLPETARRLGEDVQVEITAGQSTNLPAVSVGGRP